LILRGHIRYAETVDLFVASLLLGILNAFIRPVMILMALPLLIFTLGLFTLVINALLGSLIISVVSVVLNILTGTGKARITVRRGPPPDQDRSGGDGPVIDV
jgi:uncharacterized membrane protein YvlD (DUF360 family)